MIPEVVDAGGAPRPSRAQRPRRTAIFWLSALGLGLAPRTVLAEERGPYVDTFVVASAGRGLRFNNPYRLDRRLGGPESVSLSAPYGELGALVLGGLPTGFQHGAGLRYTFALSGISQSVVTPSYVVLHRGHEVVLPYGRVGLPIVRSPDPNVGAEAAGGLIVMMRGALGVTAELGASAFYGAATREVRATFVPVWYGQAGLVLNWEFLP